MDIGLHVLLSDRRLCMRARKNRDTWSATVEAMAPVPDRGTPASVNPSAVDIAAHVIFVSIFGAGAPGAACDREPQRAEQCRSATRRESEQDGSYGLRSLRHLLHRKLRLPIDAVLDNPVDFWLVQCAVLHEHRSRVLVEPDENSGVAQRRP